MKRNWNQVEITGRVKSVQKRDDSCMVIISSKQGNSANGGTDNRPFVYFRMADLPSWIKPGARITVRGYVESFEYSNDGITRKLAHRLIGMEYEKPKTMCMETFGIDGFYFTPPTTKGVFKGAVTNIKRDKMYSGGMGRNILRVTLHTSTDIGENDIVFSLQERSAVKKFCDSLKVGDNIGVICSLETKEKEKEGRMIRYEDFIASDVVMDTSEDTVTI